MTTSERLLARVRRLALSGPDAGSDLARVALELASEYEIAVAHAVRLDEVVRETVKKDERRGKT